MCIYCGRLVDSTKMDKWWVVNWTSANIDHPDDVEDRLEELGIALSSHNSDDTVRDNNSDRESTQSERAERDTRVPSSATVDWQGNQLDWETELEITVSIVPPLFSRRYVVEFLEEDKQVVEERSIAVGMPLMLFGAALAMLSGQVGGLLHMTNLSLLLTTIAIGAGCISVVMAETGRNIVVRPDKSPRATKPYLGPTFVAGGCLGVGALFGGLTGVLAAAMASAVTGVYLLHRDEVSGRVAELSNLLVSVRKGTPVLAGLYVLYAAIAILSIGFLLLQTASVELRNPAQIGGLWLLVGFITAILLVSIQGRSFSRSNVALAVGLTLATAGVTVLSSRVTPDVSSDSISSMTAGLIAIVLLSIWWALWVLLANRTQTVSQQFSRQGRNVSTRTAGVFAYLLMVVAATLGGSLLVWGWASWQIVTAGHPGLIMLSLATVLPAGYFLAGAIYQASSLVSTIRAFRTETTPVAATHQYHERVEALPFEPTQDIWILNSKQFFAAAYSDPFDEAIILSEGVFDYFGEQELAAIIAHEESHFEHRGAVLQLYLGTLTIFTLLGKNVVMGIYDFYTREITADERAVTQLAEYNHLNGKVGLTNVFIAQARGEIKPAKNVPQFLPTLVSMPDTIHPHTLIEDTFHLFYGEFAGNVHPTPSERLNHVAQISEQPED